HQGPRCDGCQRVRAVPRQRAPHPRVRHDQAWQHRAGGARREGRHPHRQGRSADTLCDGAKPMSAIDDINKDAEEGMKKAIDSFKRELAKIRTGRATTSMLDGIKVDYYGTPTPVNQVATVTVVDARLITIKPWEKNMIPVIDKAIRASDLGINPVADSELVRLPIPPLTQERRKELAKNVNKQTEEARVAVRSARRDAM